MKSNQLSQRWWIWLVYLLLFAVAIPWYLPKSSVPVIWRGLAQLGIHFSFSHDWYRDVHGVHHGLLLAR